MKALSSRFSDANCSTSEGIRLSGERVITRVDSFHSTSPSSPLGRTPQPPGFYRLQAGMPCRLGGFAPPSSCPHLSRRSGSIPGEPYPPLRHEQHSVSVPDPLFIHCQILCIEK